MGHPGRDQTRGRADQPAQKRQFWNSDHIGAFEQKLRAVRKSLRLGRGERVGQRGETAASLAASLPREPASHPGMGQRAP
jgi:uncharacterized protein YhjY with autotransporter beta-barrel domain